MSLTFITLWRVVRVGMQDAIILPEVFAQRLSCQIRIITTFLSERRWLLLFLWKNSVNVLPTRREFKSSTCSTCTFLIYFQPEKFHASGKSQEKSHSGFKVVLGMNFFLGLQEICILYREANATVKIQKKNVISKDSLGNRIRKATLHCHKLC